MFSAWFWAGRCPGPHWPAIRLAVTKGTQLPAGTDRRQLVDQAAHPAVQSTAGECVRALLRPVCCRSCCTRPLPAKQNEQAAELNLFDCIECGCCAQICPSHIPLVDWYRHGKASDVCSRLDERRRARHCWARRRFEAREQRLASEQAERQARRERRREKTRSRPARRRARSRPPSSEPNNASQTTDFTTNQYAGADMSRKNRDPCAKPASTRYVIRYHLCGIASADDADRCSASRCCPWSLPLAWVLLKRYYERLHIELTRRDLKVTRGILNHEEKTIPRWKRSPIWPLPGSDHASVST